MKDFKKHSITSGTLITVAMRWTDRLIGLVSTLILARLLMPEDFGIIAMASLAIGLATVMLDFGVNIALIQNQAATQDHYDTAWTLRLIQSAVGAAVLIFASPWIANYFDDSRVEPVLQVLSFSLLLNGLENIGTITFQKNMHFGADFKFLFIKRISGFFATILFAFLLQSYWALVIGTLVGRGLGVWVSYLLHPMRPRFSFVKIADIFSVSIWMFLNGIGKYFQNSLHSILVGRWFSSATMGAYTLAGEISAMPTAELLTPLNRVLFPAFAEAKEDLKKLKQMFLLAQGLQILIAVPAAIGLAFVAHEVTLILLGEKWLMVVPFIEVLALLNVAQSIGTSSGYILLVMGEFRASAIVTWVQVFLFIFLITFAIGSVDAIGIAWLRLVVSIAAIVVLFYLVIRALPIVTLWDLACSAIRPVSAVLVMSSVLFGIAESFEFPIWLSLLVKIFLGVVSYVTTIFLLWVLSGKPEGPERYLIDKFGVNLVLAKFRLSV